MCLEPPAATIFAFLFLICHPFFQMYLHCLLLSYADKLILSNKRHMKGRQFDQNLVHGELLSLTVFLDAIPSVVPKTLTLTFLLGNILI